MNGTQESTCQVHAERKKMKSHSLLLVQIAMGPCLFLGMSNTQLLYLAVSSAVQRSTQDRAKPFAFAHHHLHALRHPGHHRGFASSLAAHVPAVATPCALAIAFLGAKRAKKRCQLRVILAGADSCEQTALHLRARPTRHSHRHHRPMRVREQMSLTTPKTMYCHGHHPCSQGAGVTLGALPSLRQVPGKLQAIPCLRLPAKRCKESSWFAPPPGTHAKHSLEWLPVSPCTPSLART